MAHSNIWPLTRGQMMLQRAAAVNRCRSALTDVNDNEIEKSANPVNLRIPANPEKHAA